MSRTYVSLIKVGYLHKVLLNDTVIKQGSKQTCEDFIRANHFSIIKGY